MSWTDEEFLAELQRRFGFRLGRFLKVGPPRRLSSGADPRAGADQRTALRDHRQRGAGAAPGRRHGIQSRAARRGAVWPNWWRSAARGSRGSRRCRTSARATCWRRTTPGAPADRGEIIALHRRPGARCSPTRSRRAAACATSGCSPSICCRRPRRRCRSLSTGTGGRTPKLARGVALAPRRDAGMSREFDVVIVGAGAVGSAVASLLLAREQREPGPRGGRRRSPSPRRPAPAADWDLRVFALSRASQRLLHGLRRLAVPAAAAGVRLRAHVRVGRGRLAARAGLAVLRLRRDRRAEPRLHRGVARTAANPACEAAAAAGRRAHRGRGRRDSPLDDARCAAAPRRRTRAARRAADRRRRRGVAGPAACSASTRPAMRTIRMRWWPTCAAPSRTATPPGSASCRPDRWHSCRCRTAARRSSGARARRGRRACARSMRRRSAQRCAQPAARCSASSSSPRRWRAFRSKLQYALDYARPRAVLLGDAAHAVHPLAGQGLNLGLLDCASLAEVLGPAGAAAQLGEYRLLRRYERWRKSENLLAAAAFDGLERLFSNANPGACAAARRRARRGAAGCRSSTPAVRAARARIGGDVPAFLKTGSVGPESLHRRSILAAQMKSFSRQAADRVGRVGDAAVVVADLQIRVVVLDVGDVRERVDEAHGAVEVLELESARAGVLASAAMRQSGCELGEQRPGLGRVQRGDAALAGRAFAGRTDRSWRRSACRCARRSARPAPGIPRRCARP